MRYRHLNTAPDVRSQAAGPRRPGTDGPARTRTAPQPAHRLGSHIRTERAVTAQRRAWTARQQHRVRLLAGPTLTAGLSNHGHSPAPGPAPAQVSNRDAVSLRLGPPVTGRGRNGLRPPALGNWSLPRPDHGPGSTGNGSRQPAGGLPARARTPEPVTGRLGKGGLPQTVLRKQT